jgi:hypothetical protein
LPDKLPSKDRRRLRQTAAGIRLLHRSEDQKNNGVQIIGDVQLYPRVALGFQSTLIGCVLLYPGFARRENPCPQPGQQQGDGPENDGRSQEHHDGGPGVLARSYRKTVTHSLPQCPGKPLPGLRYGLPATFCGKPNHLRGLPVLRETGAAKRYSRKFPLLRGPSARDVVKNRTWYRTLQITPLFAGLHDANGRRTTLSTAAERRSCLKS